jgi:predicted RNA binding protein YcfA (HicA-like mRNA interferase family)
MPSRHGSYVAMKVRDILKRVRGDGWQQLKGRPGDHRQFVHPNKPGRVTIAGHEGDDVPVGTLRSILRQAGLK